MKTGKTLELSGSVVTFGRHRGTAVTDIPTDYLEWMLLRWKKPVRWAIVELERRASVMSGRDALQAQAALGTYKHRINRSIVRHRQPAHSRKPRSRHGSRSDRDRQVSYRQEDKLSECPVIVGEAYENLAKDFLNKGGNAVDCPFDAGDYRYTGPVIDWSGEETRIVPPG